MGSLIDTLLGLPPWMVLGLVFLLPALEAALFLGLLIPGESAVIVGGVVAHGGALPLWAVALAAVAGAALGDQVGFVVGRRYGDRMLTRVPGRMRRSGAVDRALGLIGRRGALAVVIGRWVAALRALVPGLAGMSGMGRLRFTVANVAGGTLWAVTMAVAGYLAGASFRVLEHRLGLGSEAVLALVVVGLVLWGLHVRRAG